MLDFFFYLWFNMTNFSKETLMLASVEPNSKMHFTMYQDELLDKYDVPRRMGALISKIAALSKKYGEGLWVSNDSLADMIKMSSRTVQKWLSSLIEKSVLAIKYVTLHKRYIFFSEEFAKDLNHVIGGGLKGYTVPRQYTVAYARDLECDYNLDDSEAEEIIENFHKTDCDSVKHEKGTTDKHRNIFLDINLSNRQTLSESNYLGFLYQEKEKRNIQESNTSESNVQDTTYLSHSSLSYSFLSYFTKRKRKQLTNYYSKDKLSHNNSDVNCFKQNLYRGKKGDLSTEDNYLSCVCSHNLDSNLLVDHPFNCNKENNTDFMNLENLEENYNLGIEKEKEKSSAQKEKEKEAWAHADAVAQERLGTHIDPPDSGDVKSSSNRYEEIVKAERMRKIEEKAEILANDSSRIAGEKYARLIAETPAEEIAKKDLSSQDMWVRAQAKAAEYLARIEEEEAEEARKKAIREAEQREIDRREQEFKENDPDGFPPVIRAEVDRIIDALQLEKNSYDYNHLIASAKAIARCVINNSVPNDQIAPMFQDLFRRFYDRIKLNALSNYFKEGGKDM